MYTVESTHPIHHSLSVFTYADFLNLFSFRSF